ncbi:uncharacterized protein EpC_35380 [Erwinia pyrifoliae Ep1/96]|nr:uncharacterized protein EpC_35380 [Erwinia pyrifoliae Ep1/96]
MCLVRARHPWRDLPSLRFSVRGGQWPPGQRCTAARSCGQLLASQPFNVAWVIMRSRPGPPLASGSSSHNTHYVLRPRVPGRGVAAFPGGAGLFIVFSKRPCGLRLQGVMPARLRLSATARSRFSLLVQIIKARLGMAIYVRQVY